MKMTLNKRIDVENLDLKQIADSGQCFRMNQAEDGCFITIADGRCCKTKQISESQIEIKYESNEDLFFWEEYFHLKYDYKKITTSLLKGEDEFLKSAVAFGKGLRILRQESFEMLISFIISQNKNIPAIKSSVEKICEKYGKEQFWEEENYKYFTFPDATVLSEASLADLRTTGLGYRDAYVKNAAVAVANGDLQLEKLNFLTTEELMKELMTIKGVGKKVASCVALFGFGKMDAVPVDVWIDRVNKDIYGGSFNWEVHRDIAGLVQQYLFYYIRNRNQE